MNTAATFRKIFLIGLPGSGKSKLGKKLAQHLQYEFVDTDIWIAEQEGISISDIFNNKGEATFRLLEKEAIRLITEQPKSQVIATGGGLPCFHNNMEYMNQHGTTIFLDIPSGILASRIVENNERPMFTEMDILNIQEKLTNLGKERNESYSQSNYKIIHSNNIFKAIKAIFKN